LYVHELPNCPTFRWDARAIAGPLGTAHHRQGRLLGRMEKLGFGLRSEAALEALTKEITRSSEIEGERLDKSFVRSSVARRLGLPVGPQPPSDRRVEGVVQMMLDATQRFAEPVTEERLHGWHAALFPTGYSGLHKIQVGAWGTDSQGPMQVLSGPEGKQWVHYQAPAAPLLPESMIRFLTWFNGVTEGDLVLKAAVAHLWFVTIHPFDDGNGRIARALADLMLARSEDTAQRFYSMSAQIFKEREAYYDILEETQKGDLNITKWLLWFLGCLDRAFGEAETVLAAVLEKAAFWEHHQQAPLNERQHRMVNVLLDGFEGKLTTSKWATLTKSSQDTASRDIGDLIKRGILVKDAAGGRSTSYSLASGGSSR
jgi:Fic family protein